MVAAVRGVLTSPRRRRRVLWLAGFAAVAATVALLVVYLRNTAPSYETPLRNEAASRLAEPVVSQPSPTALQAARITTFNFIRTAVRREHLEDSWELVGPNLKEGYTLERWLEGEIPVIPYPADLRKLGYKLAYSYVDVLGIEVSMWPQPGSKLDPIVFRAELTKAGTGPRRHWVVSSWAPPGVPLDVMMQRARAAAIKRGGPISTEVARGHPLSAVWLAVPAAILMLVLIVPAAVALRSWHRGRKAIRRYEAERAQSQRG